MKHERFSRNGSRRALTTTRRFQIASAFLLAAVLPYLARVATLPGAASDPPVLNAIVANALAVAIASWMRLSVTTYPGIRSSSVILPVAFAGYGAVIALLFLARLPYDRLMLAGGFSIYIFWAYALYFAVDRKRILSIAIVPFGAACALTTNRKAQWKLLDRPVLADALECDALVADFAADLPDEWEAFLADAALAGRVVYQVKQLSESLTGRVELGHLSENSFGSLVPERGYFHFKAFADFIVALAVLPLLLPVMALAAVAIRLEGGGKVIFRQRRIGHAGQPFEVFKFRTMRTVDFDCPRAAAMTGENDSRITRVGAFLRRSRIDELPQVFNILRFEMSWIGPRPEAEVLSAWYTGELPYYRYRHVVKPGISGWAQVNQGHVADVVAVHRKLQYDFYYIKYFSPWLDVLILFRTIKTMLNGFGAR